MDLGIKSNLDSMCCSNYYMVSNWYNNIDKMNKTLIIVDFQNDFISENRAVNDAKEVMKNNGKIKNKMIIKGTIEKNIHGKG